MGVVPMKTTERVFIHGDVLETVALYIYCDKCGSFDIKKYFSTRQWLLLIGSCSLLLLFAYLLYLKFLSRPTVADALMLLIVFLMCAVLLIGFIWSDWDFHYAYRCRKCGRSTSIRYNTRDYPSDKAIVDVPEQLIQEYYLTGWPQDGPIEAYLSPPEDAKH